MIERCRRLEIRTNLSGRRDRAQFRQRHAPSARTGSTSSENPNSFNVAGHTGNPIFIGGVPRSGTTLLRVMLDSHPRIHCGTELRVVQALASLWSSAERTGLPLLATAYGVDATELRGIFAELILAYLRPAWEASGKARVAEKTPWNLLVFPELRRLFPDSPLIHVIRDGRDVVASRLERDLAQGSVPARTEMGTFPIFDSPASQKDVPCAKKGNVPVSARLDIVELAGRRAHEWVEAMAIRRRMLADPFLSERYFELRYEDLVRRPRQTLEPLFAFLGERYDPAVLDYHRIARDVAGSEEWSAESVRRPLFEHSIGRWRHALGAEAHAVVERVAGPALAELGYLP